MENILLTMLLIALAFSVIGAIVWPRTVFLIEIRNKETILRKGKINPRLVGDLSSVVSNLEPFTGTIRGVVQVGRFSVRFSREFPEFMKQRFKNLWALHPSKR
jgi:hypothetical protein